MVPIKIALIAPGIMPIPPTGWGAVEMMLWDYYQILSKNDDIEVTIINKSNTNEIIEEVNKSLLDAVHIHYDLFVDIIPKLNSKLKILSSHYPFINEPGYYRRDGYDKIIGKIVNNNDFHIFASSPRDIETFIGFGANSNNIFLSKLGININSYKFYENPEYDKTLCFSQIVNRKRQSLIQNLEGIDFFGRLDDHTFHSPNYKGEAARDFLNQEISKYANFILVSSHENTTPLAVKEALIGGLGVVVSEAVAVELDNGKDFISIIPENKINDPVFIKNTIDYNKEVSKHQRLLIREYAIQNFDLEGILNNSYLKKIKSLL